MFWLGRAGSGPEGRFDSKLLRTRWRLLAVPLVLAGAVGLRAVSSSATPATQSPYAAVAQLARVLVLIENHYVEPVDRGRLLEGAIKGMVAELDPHSAYLPPEEFREFQNETEGAFVGIGVEVDAREDVITIVAPIDGSPAQRGGIRSGDRIVAVDGWMTRGQPLERTVRKMRGPPGSKVRITLLRAGTAAPIEVTLTRETIHVNSVIAKRLDGDIGYVRIKQFQRGTHEEFLTAIAGLRERSATPLAGVVLDMRTNPGGLVNEASAIADELLARGTIYTTRARGKILEDIEAHGGGAIAELPMSVLVNEYTASAAELVAGAVQDNRRGVIVGATTYGKGSVQSIVELPDNGGLKLTSMLYFTPSGRSIQATGIVPDVQIGSVAAANPGMPVVREGDIEGHILQPSAVDGGAPQADAGSLEGGASVPADFVISRDVPEDPTKGKDLALSIAYQLVRGVLVRNAGASRQPALLQQP